MRMQPLRDRTKQFALRVVKAFMALPNSALAQTVGKQMMRSGTSVAANFREASRARSDAEFIAKLGVVEQELDETLLWLEILVEAGVVPEAKTAALTKEADELLRIVVTSIQRTKCPKLRTKMPLSTA